MLGAQFLALGKQLPRLGRSGQALAGQLVQLGQFGVVGKLFGRSPQQLLGAHVISHAKLPIDLFDPLGLGIGAHLLLVAPADAVDLPLQPGVLRIDGPQDFPLLQRFAELAPLLIGLGLADDGVDQIAFFPHGAQGTLEMRFAGIPLQDFGQNIDALVEIGLGFHAPVDFGDVGR